MVSEFNQMGDQAQASLGIESRSILKSIQTEESKLLQSPHLTKSDIHYFLARYNYYRLSLLRLPMEERSQLEPHLNRFYGLIAQLETKENPRPFLQAISPKVQPVEPARVDAAKMVYESAPVAPVVDKVIPNPLQQSSTNSVLIPADLIQDIMQDLQLIGISLNADLEPASKQIIKAALERVVRRLKNR